MADKIETNCKPKNGVPADWGQRGYVPIRDSYVPTSSAPRASDRTPPQSSGVPTPTSAVVSTHEPASSSSEKS